jgi:hypothetical protein
MLTLEAESYSWKFMPAAMTPPATFTDEGTTACH